MDQANEKLEMRHGSAPRPNARALIDVRKLRRRMGITQRQFAGWFGFPVATLRHWERGNRKPAGAALVLLCVIADHPHSVLAAVRKARIRLPGALGEIERLKSYRTPPGFRKKSRARFACAFPRTP